MDKNECMTADWKMVGLEDGLNGKPESTIGVYRKDCAKAGVVPVLAEYQAGHQEGVRKYCTRTIAYDLGKNGGAYYHVCPSDLESPFLTAYKKGQALYEIARQKQQCETDIRNAEARLSQLQTDIASHEKAIVDANSSSTDRREHLADIKNLQRDMNDTQRMLEMRRHDMVLLEDDYQQLQTKHQKLGY